MLYICPTPIGNIEDITIRTLNTFRQVDEIYCEDTRRTIKLLNYYEIKKPLFSLHQHNENQKSEEVIQKLKQGKNIAYASDAGMPGISDPGAILVRKCIDEGLEVTTLPGASAMIVALVNSGIDTRYFTFIGFLERETGKKKKQIQEIKRKTETIIIYESPHRIKQTVKDLYEGMGNRKITIAREISKKYEEYIRTDLETLYNDIREKKTEIIGEIIIIIQGNENPPENDEKIFTDEDIKLMLSEKINKGKSAKDAVKEVARQTSVKKNRIYEISLTI